MLVLQQLIEAAGSHRRPQAELQFTVKVLLWLAQLREGRQHIAVAPGGDQVQAQAHLVTGENLLAADLQRLNPRIDQFHADLMVVPPEAVLSRRQQLQYHAVDLEHAHVIGRHLRHQHPVQPRQLARIRLVQAGNQGSVQPIVATQIQAFQMLSGLAFPIQLTAARREDLHQHALLVAQAHLVVAEVHAGEMALHQRRFGLAQVTGQTMLEQRRVEAECLHAQAVVQVEVAIGARLENGEEIALGVEQATLVLLHGKALEYFHDLFSFSSNHPGCQCSPTCRVTQMKPGRDGAYGHPVQGLNPPADACLVAGPISAPGRPAMVSVGLASGAVSTVPSPHQRVLLLRADAVRGSIRAGIEPVTGHQR